MSKIPVQTVDRFGSTQSRSPDPGAPRTMTASAPFLRDLRIEHGPLGLLGRFFLKADQAAQSRGVTLAFASLEDVRAVNEQNQDTWGALMPMFDPASHVFEPDKSLCILGYNAEGEVVATHAARVYDMRETDLKRASEDLTLFYGSAKPEKDAFCQVTASSAERIKGMVAYSGCGWYRPDYRGKLLSMILPRISRALELALWNADFSVSFVDWILVEKGVIDRYGYRHTDDGVLMRGIIEANFPGAVVWMHRSQLLEDLRAFLSGSLPEIDVSPVSRGGHHKRLAQRTGER